MGLSASLSNALSGMGTSQAALEIVSRNVSNSGTPGYHRQSLTVIDTKGVNSDFARTGGVNRAFNTSLQVYYTKATSDAGYASARADMLDRLQTYLGKPGDTGSLDTMFASLQNALQSLSTSPDNYATRAQVVSQAQGMASTLNQLSMNVQGLRQETETQMAIVVNTLNQDIGSLAQVNQRLAAQNGDDASRAALMDQRDRLISDISEQIDVQVDYRSDGSVALMTRTGVGLLDVKPSTFSYEAAGPMTAEKTFDPDSTKSGVGKLKITTPSGLQLDLVQQNVLSSGKLKSLIDLRDKTLVTAQGQLDEIAAGLAQAFSTVTTAGTPASAGTQNGLSTDISAIRDGNDFTLTYSVGGVEKNVKVVRVDDPNSLPLDYPDANGTRVIGLDFSAGAASIASTLSGLLGPGLTITGAGNTITVLDDGAANTSDVTGLVSHATVTGTQTGNAAFSLFVDTANSDFTNSLDDRGQKLGFAARIGVNSAVLSDNKLVVQSTPGGSLGDASRANALLDQLQNMNFASAQTSTFDLGSFRLGGSVSDMITQTMDYTGTITANATSDSDAQQTAMDALSQRLDSEYGVNVDEEMARLMELQNAYAANSRVISVVQDLMNKLLEI